MRDPARTRAALVDAARWLLTRRSYDQMGTRDVAERAGVDAALVQRYFGSKKKLFEVAVDGAYSISRYLGDRSSAELAPHIARLMVEPTKDRNQFDATQVMIRSSASAEVQKILAEALERDFVSPLADRLDGTHRRTRATMALAVLAGFDLMRVLLRSDALDAPEAGRLLERLLKVCLED